MPTKLSEAYVHEFGFFTTLAYLTRFGGIWQTHVFLKFSKMLSREITVPYLLYESDQILEKKIIWPSFKFGVCFK